LLSERLAEKDKDIKELRELIGQLSNEFDDVFTNYYPKYYVPSDTIRKTPHTSFEIFRRQNYTKVRNDYPGI
jgi:hypothetical protein